MRIPDHLYSDFHQGPNNILDYIIKLYVQIKIQRIKISTTYKDE